MPHDFMQHAHHRFTYYVVGNPVDYVPEEPMRAVKLQDFRAWCRREIGRTLRPGEITLHALLYKEYRG